MKLFKMLKTFRAEEDGAVTVDWVVLTAAVVGLGAAALAMVSTSTGKLTGKIAGHLESATIKTAF